MAAAPGLLQRAHGALRRVPSWSVYLLCMVPGALLVAAAFADRLGPDPAGALVKELGEWSLRLLILGLAITPIRELTGLNLVRFRRAVGLAAFTTVVLHLAGYTGLYSGFDLTAIGRDILRRPYITIGMAAFAILVPLAATSTDAMIRRMGPRAWRRLHKAVYVAAILGAVHFVLLVKAWPPEPLIYLAIVLALIGWRLLPRRRARFAPA